MQESKIQNLAILIPVFNDEDGCSKTLNSIEGEQITAKIIIVEDGSAKPINLPEFCGRNRIYGIRTQPHSGFEAALNQGILTALEMECDLVARLDAGDQIYPGRFQLQVETMALNPMLGLIGVHTEFVNPDGMTLYRWRPPHDLRKIRRFMHLQNPFVHSGVMYRASMVKEVGMYRTNTPAAEDYDLFFRISQKFDVAILPKILMKCELNPTGISVKKRKQQIKSTISIKMRYFAPMLIESYIGIFRGLISYILPLETVNLIKKILWK
jgi:glycosyltransferase involved in cell wall biosynthesis